MNISHFAIGHLTVILTSPAGTSVTLHNRTGGTADNLVGNWTESLFVDGPGILEDFLDEPVQGTWTLPSPTISWAPWAPSIHGA